MSWKKLKKNPYVKAGAIGLGVAGLTLAAPYLLPATAGAVGIGGLGTAGGLGLGAAGLYGTFKNFDLQQKNYERQWESYETQLAREDTSIARRVSDLKAAGLSPVLAAGSGATSQAVFTGKAPQMENPIDNVASVLGLLQMKENITNTMMQRDLIESQIIKTGADAAIRWHDYGIYKKSGTASNASGLTKDIQGLLGLIGSNPTLLKLKEEMERKAQRYNDSSLPGTWRDMITTSGGLFMSQEPKNNKGGSK